MAINGSSPTNPVDGDPIPGEFAHVDIKKPGNVPDGGGHEVPGQHA
ncbi:hypothetical protein [Streptomyces sp. NPDC055632]